MLTSAPKRERTSGTRDVGRASQLGEGTEALHPGGVLRWWVRVLALLVAAYALSPIDLIPDFIPVLGYVDDLLIVPLGVLLVLKLIPPDVTRAAKERALAVADKPTSRVMAVVIVTIWVALAGLVGLWVWRLLRS